MYICIHNHHIAFCLPWKKHSCYTSFGSQNLHIRGRGKAGDYAYLKTFIACVNTKLTCNAIS